MGQEIYSRKKATVSDNSTFVRRFCQAAQIMRERVWLCVVLQICVTHLLFLASASKSIERNMCEITIQHGTKKL